MNVNDRWASLPTPCAVVDEARVRANIQRLQARIDGLGVALRPHVKTAKCLEIARAQREAGGKGLTASTLEEAERFHAAGFGDILYSVGIAIPKLPRAVALVQRGCALKLVTDNVPTARATSQAFADAGLSVEVWIEIDADGRRAGVAPESAALIEVAAALAEGSGARLGGLMSHAGSVYAHEGLPALAAVAELERRATTRAAERLRAAGFDCPVVSIGSSPAAFTLTDVTGVTELRAGVYVFFDLVGVNQGICTIGDLALSVLVTVIGHQADKGWALTDGGWMALSADHGTASQAVDYGYGQVCTEAGEPMAGYRVSVATQEHGIVTGPAGTSIAAALPVGTRLRVLPNHACATAAQFRHYDVLSEDGSLARWPRLHGW